MNKLNNSINIGGSGGKSVLTDTVSTDVKMVRLRV
jgi:hypothetical protein